MILSCMSNWWTCGRDREESPARVSNGSQFIRYSDLERVLQNCTPVSAVHVSVLVLIVDNRS